MRNIILASKSFDRKEIFNRIRIHVIDISSEINEEDYKVKIKDPLILVKELAKAKAINVKNKIIGKYMDAIIIAADTIIEFKGEIIGKAKDEDHAFKILKKLVGKTHNLITGIAIIELSGEKIILDFDKTQVEFLNLSDNEIKAYVKTQEWEGKAGAYSLREKASMFVKSINGSYSNVLGLPMQKLYQILKNDFRINLLELYK
ncbi:MAG: septum formation protein Maf [Candidatus Lokiarchaeota archaeon]|nr:septum formation protein Maf [Candidatus Lokiarchaeota archaeon]